MAGGPLTGDPAEAAAVDPVPSPAAPPFHEAEPLAAADGTALAVARWLPDGAAAPTTPRASLVIVHGIAEHAGRYARAVAIWAGMGFEVIAFDLRGHGRSGGRRVYVERWARYLDDLGVVLAATRMEEPERPLVLFGHSMGALIALDYACNREPGPDLLVLSAPPLSAAAPAWQRLAAPLLSRVAPTLVIANPIDGAQLSRDPAVGAAYFADPLVQPRSTARLGAELFAAMRRNRKELGRLAVPTLVVHGERDRLVPTPSSEPLAAIPGVERRVLAGLRHESLNEPEGPDVARAIGEWALARLPSAG